MLRTPFDILARPLARRRVDLALATTAAVVSQCIGIPLALLTRRLVNLADGPADAAGAEQTIWLLGGGLAVLALLRGVASWFQLALSERVAQGVVGEVRSRMHSHLHCLGLGYFDRRAVGRTLVRFVGDAASLRSWISRVLIAVPADAITVAGVLVALALIGWPLVLAAAAPPLLLVPLLWLLNPRARLRTREARREQARLSGDLTDQIEDIAAIRAARAEAPAEAEAAVRIERVRDAFAARGRLDAWARAGSLTAGSLALCGIGVLGSVMLLRDAATTGDIVAAVWLALVARVPISRLAQANIVHQRAAVAAERIRALLERQPEPGRDATLERFTGVAMRIRLKNVGYREPGGSWVLRGLDMTLQGPAVVLLSGPRRATRTVNELLLRLRRPHQGRVALDWRNARRLYVGDIRDRIGWVDRERRVVSATLAVRSIDDLRAAWCDTGEIAPEAGLSDSVSEWRGAGRRPAELGGATAFRLALVCALVGDRPILLIEEPTQGLDDDAVGSVLSLLACLGRERLLLISSSDQRVGVIATRTLSVGSRPGARRA